MALETCLRAWALHAPQAGSRERLSSSSYAPSRPRTAAPAVVTPSPSPSALVAPRRPSRFVCQCKNVVDEEIRREFEDYDDYWALDGEERDDNCEMLKTVMAIGIWMLKTVMLLGFGCCFGG